MGGSDHEKLKACSENKCESGHNEPLLALGASQGKLKATGTCPLALSTPPQTRALLGQTCL